MRHPLCLLYTSEYLVGRLSKIFTLLAILISCLGLIGLSTFTAEQRVKEIGIRKVLGASITSLFSLLSLKFLILGGIVLVIAIPGGWLVINSWLNRSSTQGCSMVYSDLIWVSVKTVLYK